ncbi:ABC transporter permease [Porticoccus sp. W117]|uniref:ABC transporter permease n=1 Tax=Porticoccus sp. W117 TaxID=3054777 RepID=UPI0025987680|nr:ABC transporter permease [Porticoccus sp. W117]MDM3871335.1 ABC transporter permease [Porticoccus sp. W117]
MLLKLARHSLWNRRGTALLTVVSLTVSITLLLAIDHIRREAKASFTSALSGTDLVVGARSSNINLLLYSVFHIGDATSNISWNSYQIIDTHSSVAWTVPISLGDSHKGYRVIGTSKAFFEHYKFGQKQQLQLATGAPFDDHHGVVLGAQVARKLGYQLGDKVVLAHGTSGISFTHHDNHPFSVVGILKPTGTPVDRSLLVSLEGIEAIHLDWQPQPGEPRNDSLQPKNITACLIGLASKAKTFSLQRKINSYKGEPLLAILPGATLAELWRMLGVVENLLYLISVLVLLATLTGMVTTLLAAMKERQREIAILRAIGAHPLFLFLLIELEVLLLAALSIVCAFTLLSASLTVAAPWLAAEYGLFLSATIINHHNLVLAVVVLVLATILGAIPAYRAYRNALQNGLVINS